MEQYIDGFVFPIPSKHLVTYQQIAQEVAEIWIEHGALAYHEFLAKGNKIDGTKSFEDLLNPEEDEQIIFGFTLFPSEAVKDRAHQLVSEDERMNKLIEPLLDPKRLIFNAEKMVYGGFQSFVSSEAL